MKKLSFFTPFLMLVLFAAHTAFAYDILGSNSKALITTPSQYPAGIYTTNTPNQELRVAEIPSQLMVDGFDAALDTTTRWNTPTTSGTATAAVASGNFVVATGTTTGYAYTTSKNSFQDQTPGQLRFAYNVQIETTPYVASTYRFWGAGTPQAAPTTAGCPACSNTMVDAVGFEVNTDQKMYAVVYKTGVRTVVADLSGIQPTDGLTHNYATFWRAVKTHWFLDSQEVPVATGNFVNSALNKDSLPAAYLAVQGATTNASISSNTMSVSDTARNNQTISDGIFGWRKATVAATNTNASATLLGLGVLPSIARSAVIAATAGNGVAQSVDSVNGSLNVRLTDSATYLSPGVLANDTTAIANGLSVQPGVSRAVPTAVTAGRAEMEQMDAATGGQYVAPVATITATGFSTAVVSANTATAVKASAGNIYGISASSSSATPCYVQFYNSNAPTCGTAVISSIAMPPTPGVVNMIADIPLMNFATGIGVCFSTTQSGAVTCTGTLSATVFYK